MDLPADPPALMAPAGSLDRLLNDLTERLGGRDLRTRWGGEGRAVLPAIAPREFEFDTAARQRLARSVVFLVPGGTWPGVAHNGGGWLVPWARMLESGGLGRAVPIPLLSSQFPPLATFAPVFNTVLGFHDRWVQQCVESELARRPLAPGGQIYLLGHSVGAAVALRACETLLVRGCPISGAIVLETHLATTGRIVRRVPALSRLLVAENERGFWPKTAPGTHTRRLLFTGLGHMDLVLRPPAALISCILTEIARR